MSKSKTILLGKKLGMTQVYNDQGVLVPVTVVQAGPCPIARIRPLDSTDSLFSIQIAYQPLKKSQYKRPQVGHFAKANLDPHAYLFEFSTSERFDCAQVLTVDRFQKGDILDVTAQTKGHGFQGVMKRWGFAGGPASHGSMFHRRGGGFGQRQEPGEIMKNRKMPGQMGNKMRTVQNLEIVDVILDQNLILIKGSFAGAKNSLVLIRSSKKQ